MKVNELLTESVKELSSKTKKVFFKLAKLAKTEPLKKNFVIGDSGDFEFISASEIKNVDHGVGLIFESSYDGNIVEIFFFDGNTKKWIRTGKLGNNWDMLTASEVIKLGRSYDDDCSWVEVSPKNNRLLKEANTFIPRDEMLDFIPRDIRRAAMHAGYDINKKELRTMTGLKVAYAKRALESEYADQFDARLGELLDMIDMDEKQLKRFIKKNG